MNPKVRLLVGAIVALVAVAAFYKGVLAPKYARASVVQADIDESQGVLDQARAQTHALETAKAGYSRDYTTLARLGKAVPVDDDVRSLLVQINTAAGRSGVDFRSIQLDASDPAAATARSGSAAATQAAAATLPPGASVGAAGLPTMPFSFEFEGSFLDLSGFMARLQRFVTARGSGLDVRGRLLAVDGFSLKPSSKGFPHVTASVGATAYLVKPSQGSGGGATLSEPAGTAAPAAKSAVPAAGAPVATTSSAGGIR